MEKVRFGIIGLGNQGCSYMLNLFDGGAIDNGVVTAVCDNNPVKLENVKNSTSNENVAYFADYKEMLDSGLCDAILVETPHYYHPEMVMECLKRGIHVICEKPAGVYTKHVKEMNEAAKNSDAHFAMMFNQRTNCVYRKMKEIIAQGGIGDLQRVSWIITDWFRTQFYYDNGSWRATWAGEGGGVLINQCPHQIDLVSWVIGEMPVSVNAFCKYGKWHDIEVEDEVTAYFEYANGATGTFVTTTGETPGTNRFEVSGTKGKLLCEGSKLVWYKNEVDSQEYVKTSQETWKRPEVEIVEVETDGKNPQHAGIINNFANALLGKEEFFVDGLEGINGVELMNAIELSGWKSGAKVCLPVDEDEYLAELNKRRATSRLKVGNDNYVQNTAGSYGSKVKK
ncbi:MAG: Gfo/Idh/MocA family oxidoreductase [Clostridia bacterium]|nr:Gfo/Idh/MocA family oxidoreductase [Clostridia bacterium]